MVRGFLKSAFNFAKDVARDIVKDPVTLTVAGCLIGGSIVALAGTMTGALPVIFAAAVGVRILEGVSERIGQRMAASQKTPASNPG